MRDRLAVVFEAVRLQLSAQMTLRIPTVSAEPSSLTRIPSFGGVRLEEGDDLAP